MNMIRHHHHSVKLKPLAVAAQNGLKSNSASRGRQAPAAIRGEAKE